MERADCLPAGRPGIWDAWVVVAIGALTATTIVGRLADQSQPRRLMLDLLVGVVATGLMVLLPRRPVGTAVAMALLVTLSPAGTPASTAATLGIAMRSPQRTAIAMTAVQVTAHLVQGIWRPIGGLSFGWFALLVVAVHVALLAWGQWMQARRLLLENLLDRAQRAEAEQGRRVAEARTLERTRMAREMHDVLAHRLSLLATYAGALEYRPDSSPEKLAQAAGVIRTGVHQALDELREVISVLRDTEIEEGPGGRPQPTFGDVEGLVAESRAAGTTVAYDERVDEVTSLPPATGRTAYRIVQEGLTNARKHAAGHPVTVSVSGRPGDGLRIALTNPGSSGVPIAPGSGTGLVGLTERVQLAGGTLDHQREPGGGFRLEASLPWPA
ncbi:sensor histidine kinase [Kribbella antibiotica]|uniref:histidine kinase n=1 Tax=Kribbella antibiotica TaxID=190195 RepID=A0A4R4YQ10_9ACTN|nr:histidine kinase [Kribbella antibiotica]TDD47265.1 sensor histidine kinase [Kribbella antibiotica]